MIFALLVAWHPRVKNKVATLTERERENEKPKEFSLFAQLGCC